ncbi:MAG: capsular polysaccharide biosynthesis protein [Pseudomonadota bacterium]
MRFGLPGQQDAVGIWGGAPTAWRGAHVSRARAAPLIRLEDAPIRSLFPGRSGEPTLGLTIDTRGLHFDPAAPSDLELLLSSHPLNDPRLLARATDAMDFIARRHLSKYAATDPGLTAPGTGHVVVIDQAQGDASLTATGADAALFRDLLERARHEHPNAPIIVKAHPETALGHRPGHLGPGDLSAGMTLLSEPISPTNLFSGARAVYAVSSGLGAEAIYHGHKPIVAGGPFYAGWGLSEDLNAFPRRGRALTSAQLFAAAMILFPMWYDPIGDRLTELEDVLYSLDARARAWREDRSGWHAEGMTAWKRPHIKRVFGQFGKLSFGPPRANAKKRIVWARRANPEDRAAVRVEDGFLRSRGLGAALTPPVSLVADDLGIYYDPRRESRLEHLIAAACALPEADLARARALSHQIIERGLSKYGVGAAATPLPDGHRILIPGQVPDDASVQSAAGEITTDAALLRLARQKNPNATLIYKPHPDVVAGFREGTRALDTADVVLADVDPALLLDQVQEVWTMTSLLGFEALLRGVPVTTTGAPFYAGWGLTTDLGAVPDRRTARPSRDALVHAALVDYPRYSDPVTGRALSPEAAVYRLAHGPWPGPRGGLARLQHLRAAWLR